MKIDLLLALAFISIETFEEEAVWRSNFQEEGTENTRIGGFPTEKGLRRSLQSSRSLFFLFFNKNRSINL